MDKYLIFIETGGSQGDYKISYSHYYICEGTTEEEAVINWYNKVNNYMKELYKTDQYKNYKYNQTKPKLTCENGVWRESGYILQVIKLKEFEDNGVWKKLKWI